MTHIRVTASRWSGGWELEISDDQHTQVATLAQARQQVVDFLDTVDESVDHSDWVIDVVPEIEGLDEVMAAREATRAAVAAQAKAAALSRAAAAGLRAQGLSVSDGAAVMGVSRGRFSQLVNG